MGGATAAAGVLIADSNAAIRAGLRLALGEEDFRVIAECVHAEQVIQLAESLRPHLCLLDIRLPGDAIVAVAAIRRLSTRTRVIMLTTHHDDADLFASLDAGAIGYLLKDFDPDRLPNALAAVLAGEALIPRHLTLRLVEELRAREVASWSRGREAVPGAEHVTEREWQIVRLLDAGYTTNAIAALLVVSPVTVRSHIASIVRKVGAKDRESAVRSAVRSLRRVERGDGPQIGRVKTGSGYPSDGDSAVDTQSRGEAGHT